MITAISNPSNVKYASDSSNLKGRRILIFQQRGWAIIMGHALAKKLSRQGCRLAALTFKQTTHQFILSQKKVSYEMIVSGDSVTDDPRAFLGDDDFSLDEICKQLGVDSFWPIIQAHRFYVKSYQEKYFYSYKQGLSDERIIEYIKAVYKNIRNIFNSFSPEVVIAPAFVSTVHAMFCLYANRHGIEMIGVTDSKIRGINLFNHHYRDKAKALMERVKELNQGLKSNNETRAKDYINKTQKNLLWPTTADRYLNDKKESVLEKLRHELKPFHQIIRYYLYPRVNKMKNVGITRDCLSPRYILRDHFLKKQYTRAFNSFEYYPFNKIGNFIYYPLQHQPEHIDLIAPHFNNQIETARQIAMSMPGDYSLVVKEHPAMVGYRPFSYLKKIARTPNVKLIDYRIKTETVLRKAKMVIATPNISTIAEAAFLRVPAIQFDSDSTSFCLPNTFSHTDFTTLSQKIKDVLKFNLHTDAYMQSLIYYVAAVYDVGFEIDFDSLWEGLSREGLDDMIRLFVNEISSTVNNKKSKYHGLVSNGIIA